MSRSTDREMAQMAPRKWLSPWPLLTSRVCSTPFGITEVGTEPASRVALEHRQVLNAFRHHRGGHIAATSVTARCRLMCSTPFGITEVGITLRRHDRRRDRRGAQRLSASQRWARRSQLTSPDRSTMCSTPFGITEVGTLDELAHRRAAVACAQRLSASQRWARPGSRPMRRDRAECSTPFGITEVGIAMAGSIASAVDVCSTPFGITEVGISSRSTSCSDRATSAQRLSASQRWALAATQHGVAEHRGAQRLSASQRWAR